MVTFFLRSLALSVPIYRNFQSNGDKYPRFKLWIKIFTSQRNWHEIIFLPSSGIRDHVQYYLDWKASIVKWFWMLTDVQKPYCVPRRKPPFFFWFSIHIQQKGYERSLLATQCYKSVIYRHIRFNNFFRGEFIKISNIFASHIEYQNMESIGAI